MFQFSPVALVAGFFLSVAQPALAKNVKVMPIGSHDGEFCRFDRATLRSLVGDGWSYCFSPALGERPTGTASGTRERSEWGKTGEVRKYGACGSVIPSNGSCSRGDGAGIGTWAIR